MALRRSLFRWHIWLAWIAGLPLLLWALSGLVMVARPIEEVRATDLRADPRPLQLAGVPVPPLLNGRAVEALTLVQRVDGPVWQVRFADGGRRAASIVDGRVLPDINAALALRIANGALKTPGQVVDVVHFAADAPPLELRQARASWRVRYADGLHVFVDAQTGEVLALRSRLWRAYDVMWGIHILDPFGRENTHHPLLMAAAIVGLISILIGIWLLFLRQMRRKPA
ncbi:MAG: PepSY domain-containing protein [Sphingomonadaceae bacterium]|nr:PepSY domain-containing protein [Sphingomonadaceae bacterium]